MAGMLNSLRLDLDGKHHCGLDDCRNIAKIVRKMIEDGCIIEVIDDIAIPLPQLLNSGLTAFAFRNAENKPNYRRPGAL